MLLKLIELSELVEDLNSNEIHYNWAETSSQNL